MFNSSFFRKSSIISVIVAITIIAGFFGCQKVSNFETIDQELQDIENSLMKKSFSIKKDIIISKDNRGFFDAIAQHSKGGNEIKLKNIGDISKEPVIEKAIKNYQFKEGDVLSDVETKVLKSFFNSMNTDVNKVFVSQYYIEQLEKISIDVVSKKRCLSFLTLIKDMYVFLYTNNVEIPISSPILKSGSEQSMWDAFLSVNSFETCHERCMYKKLDAIFNEGNWIDKAAFIVGCPVSVLWIEASCAWNCF